MASFVVNEKGNFVSDLSIFNRLNWESGMEDFLWEPGLLEVGCCWEVREEQEAKGWCSWEDRVVLG